MKGSVIAFLLVVLAGAGLYYLSNSVAESAESNKGFVTLYNAAKAARLHGPLYTEREAAVESSEAALEKSGVAPAIESTDADEPAPIESTDAAGSRAAFHYPPYVAIMFIPLTFIASIKTAALTLYWINVGLVIIAAWLATYTLSGMFSAGGRSAMYIVPLLGAAPFIYYYLPTQGLVLFALVLVLAGLAAYRQKLDIIGGLITSLALFSPLGSAFAVYYLLKRSWTGFLGVAIGFALFFVGLPMLIYHVDPAIAEMKAYNEGVVSPSIADFTDNAVISSVENQSVWSMLARRSAEITSLGEQAQSAYKIELPAAIGSWTKVAFIVMSLVLGLGTLAGVTRKLRDRGGLIVGLEGALVVLAVLILSPYTSLAGMVMVLLPLFAVVHVIMATDLKRVAHHVNYVGLILAIAFFYLTLDPVFRIAGSAFAGAFILWIAVLAGISRFKPQIVTGRAAVTYGGPAAKGKAKGEKPIELAKISAQKESVGLHLEAHNAAAGARASVMGKSSTGPKLPPSEQTPFVTGEENKPLELEEPDTRTQIHEPKGLAKLFMHFKRKDLPSLDLGGEESKEKGKESKPAPPDDKKITLE